MGFFSPDNWYWKPFGYVGDAVILSGMWLLGSIPVVTAGAATTALYDCVAHCVRGGEKDVLSRFLSTAKREWKQAFLSTLIWGGALGLGYRMIKAYAAGLPNTNAGVMAVTALLFLLTVGIGLSF